MSFFGLILTSLVTVLHLYVFYRLYDLPFFKNRIGQVVLVAAGVLLWLVFFLGRLYGGHEYGWGSAVLEVAGMHWMGSVFLLAVAFLIADIACGFGFLFPLLKTSIRTAGLGVGVMLVVISHIQGLRLPEVETCEVTVKKLPARLDGICIGVMADLHAGEMMVNGPWLAERVDQLMGLHPDCIVLAGDLFERGADPSEFVPVMARLTAPLGVWAVRGNHDRQRPGRPDATGRILAGAGIRLLENEWENIADGLTVSGIRDLTVAGRRPGLGAQYIEQAVNGVKDSAIVLLSHTPWMVEAAAAAGADLMISGHTHNGQIWPFSYLVKTRYPYIRGCYAVSGMTLVVSRGTGTWGPRMRLWSAGEISLITLRAAVN